MSPARSRTLLALTLLAAPVAGRLAAQDSPENRPFASISRTLLAGRDSLVKLTRQQVGLRYRLGAVRPGKAFDCSGLVKWIMSAFDLHLPRTAAEQARLGIEVPRDTTHLVPGDLLFFGRGRRVTHIGIYVGDGRFVHAANRRKGVIESALPDTTTRWWKGARRVLMDEGSLSELVRSPSGT